MRRTPKCTATIMIPGGLISPMGRQTRGTLSRQHLSLPLSLSLPKIARTKKCLAYVESTRRVTPSFFFNPLSSRFLTFMTGHQTSRHKGTKNGVRRLSNIPTYLEGWPRGTWSVFHIRCYSASLIGGFDIRKSPPAEDNMILWRRSRYWTLCS